MLSRYQREILGKLAQPGWFLRSVPLTGQPAGMYLYRRDWTVHNMGRVVAATFRVLRRRGLIEPEECSGQQRWIISRVGKGVLQVEYRQRVVAAGPDVEYTDQHGGY